MHTPWREDTQGERKKERQSETGRRGGKERRKEKRDMKVHKVKNILMTTVTDTSLKHKKKRDFFVSNK